jgi:hypothetical protein
MESAVPGEGFEPFQAEAETQVLNCHGWSERVKCSHWLTPEMDTKWTDHRYPIAEGHEAVP